jgi:ADP-heptose:LPS heptosyltransferase
VKTPISFKLKEAYKIFTKSLAIHFIKVIYGPVKTASFMQKSVHSAVILTQERYGDIIVTTPLFKLLKQIFPAIEITVIGVTHIIEFLEPDGNVDFVCNIKHADRQTKRRVFSKEYDLLFNTKDHASVTFLLLTARLNARYKVGIYHKRHNGFFHHLLRLEDAIPTIEKNTAILSYLGYKVNKQDLKPYLPEGEVSDKIRNFIKNNLDKRIIGINLSASNKSKEWGPARWEEFLEDLREDILIISTGDLAEVKLHFEQTYANVISSPPTATIYDVGYLVKNLHMLITPDTSLVHIASCYNTPVLALYRIERDLKKFLPLSDKNEVIVAPDGIMNNILPEKVLDSYKILLSKMTEGQGASDF